MSHEVIVEPNGMVRFIYDDDLASVMQDVGSLSVARASHVEPTSDGRWSADMSPVGGPMLGPFDTRSEALTREVDWLNAHDVPVPVEVLSE
jgi:hypothetical protein